MPHPHTKLLYSRQCLTHRSLKFFLSIRSYDKKDAFTFPICIKIYLSLYFHLTGIYLVFCTRGFTIKPRYFLFLNIYRGEKLVYSFNCHFHSCKTHFFIILTFHFFTVKNSSFFKLNRSKSLKTININFFVCSKCSVRIFSLTTFLTKRETHKHSHWEEPTVL